YVYALDASTGSLKWKFQTGDYIRDSSPAVSGGVVYIGSQDNYVYAIEASTGSLKWEYKTGDAVYASPAISGGVVYVGSTDHYVYALDASSGSLKWKSEYVWYPSSSAVSGGVLYVPQLSGILYAFAPAQPLAISISSPSSGQSFTTSTITISGTASDDIGLNKVEIRVNAGSWQLASGTTSWSKQVTLSSGENTIYARATVTSGNTAETSVTVSYNPPPHPSTGSVSVSSSPSGASVYLDGSYQGTTPKTITSIEEGSHTITLKLTDYEDGSQPINVVAGQTIGVSQDLAKSPTPTSTIIADNTLFNPYVLSAITSALIIAIATIIGAWINSRRRS
ncbi:MAG: PQQ-binding-like beta-propeller repeat protein, partial [Candidatus Latescibacteria bacterium]|nr:PQQ-binding-like beta-propeller repeat protein [Candidatus Latescibacterota bacterium]